VKSTGIVRRVDELGRVVLPIELRRTLSISDKDSLEIYVDEEKSSCGSMSPLVFSVVTQKTLSLTVGKTSVTNV